MPLSAFRKLRPYFHTQSIEVLTNCLLRQVLQKPKASGRLLKWVIKLGQFAVNKWPRMAIKGQALTVFIVEFTYSNTIEIACMVNNAKATKGVETEKGRTFAT